MIDGSTSRSASGSQKSPKCIFIQRSWYRVVRDAFGVPELLPEVLPEVLPEGRKLPKSIKGRAECSVAIGLWSEHSWVGLRSDNSY